MAGRIAVAAAVIRKGEKFLAAQRPLGGPYGGQWEFPGGKLEPGESAEQALVRELKEELDIAVRSARLVMSLAHEYPEFHVTLHLYEVTAFSGEIKAMDKQNLAWLTPREAAALPFLAADVPIVQKLAQSGS